jgi:DNA repair exonuclease SbcCD ATPase subunit
MASLFSKLRGVFKQVSEIRAISSPENIAKVNAHHIAGAEQARKNIEAQKEAFAKLVQLQEQFVARAKHLEETRRAEALAKFESQLNTIVEAKKQADETKRDTQAAIKMLDEWEALLSQGQPEAQEQLNAVRDELQKGLPKKDGGRDGG